MPREECVAAPSSSRRSYTNSKKLEVIEFATEKGNRAAARKHGVDESLVRRWRLREDDLKKQNPTARAAGRGQRCRWPGLEKNMASWITAQRDAGRAVNTGAIRLKASEMAKEMGQEDFISSPAWCFRFLKRSNLSIRTAVGQRSPDGWEEKVQDFKSFVHGIVREHNFPLIKVGNMDERVGEKSVKVTIESCHRCNVKGATVGCEVKQCKRTYHYPCARKDGADIIEDRLKGTYKVYCQKHGANTESSTGKVPLCRELLFDGYDDAKAGPSGGHDSDTSRHHNHMSPKIPGSFKEENKMPQQQSPWRLKRKRRTLVIESDSGEDEHMVDLECAPLESDLDSSVTWQDKVTTPPQDPPSNDADSAVASTSGHACPLKEGGGEDMSIDSDESESLLLPVTILPASQSTAGSGHSPTFIPTSPLTCGPTQPSNSKGSPSTHTATFPSSPEGCQVPTSPPSSSTLFWKSCNQAGCTADIFNTFFSDMRDISSRILTDQASQEDYDVSLRVLEASGKLSLLVTENRKALERKQKEVQRSLAALKTASSVLKR